MPVPGYSTGTVVVPKHSLLETCTSCNTNTRVLRGAAPKLGASMAAYPRGSGRLTPPDQQLDGFGRGLDGSGKG
eukprot:3676704-Rhodomonas_salina.1